MEEKTLRENPHLVRDFEVEKSQTFERASIDRRRLAKTLHVF